MRARKPSSADGAKFPLSAIGTRRARKEIRRRLARNARPDRRAQGGEPRIFGGERGIDREPRLDLHHPGGVEFAVESSVEQKDRIIAQSHVPLPSLSISRARARASRDITVPIGASIAAAISR